MSMGNYACHADTVTDDFVKEQCPERYEALIDYLKGIGIDDLDSVAQGLDETLGGGEIEGVTDKQDKKIKELIDELADAFVRETGLILHLLYHESQDRGDDVDGAFWEVDNVYILSPAGEKYKNKIERKFWTVFG